MKSLDRKLSAALKKLTRLEKKDAVDWEKAKKKLGLKSSERKRRRN